MTEPGVAVRAAARVTDDARPAGPAVLAPRRRPGYLGPVHLTQLVVAEAALVAVVAAVAGGPLAVAVAAAGAVLLFALALGRRQHRWWLEHRMMRWRYARRRRAVPAAGDGDDPRLAALRVLAPGLTVTDVPVADGAQVGVARDDAGWFAVVAIGTRAPMRDDPGDRLPLDVLTAALADMDQPGAVLQVVRHTVPALGVDADPASPAGRSYQQVLAAAGRATPLAAATWVAVRLDARTLAESGTDTGDQLDRAPAVVAAVVRGVAKSLRRLGIPYQVLDAAGVVGALARSCDLDVPAAPEEDWTRWRSAHLVHRSYWVRRWPPVEDAAAVLERLAAAPAATTNLALILTPDDRDDVVDVRCLVRFAAPSDDLDRVCTAALADARRAHAELSPLDGEQGPAVYASAPTGGGAQ